MKHLLTFWISCLLINCVGQSLEHPQQFINELGPVKAKSFSDLMRAWEEYLNDRYPEIKTTGGRTKAFLFEILNAAEQDQYPDFQVDSLSAIRVIEGLENSDLRKDLFLFSSEVASYLGYDLEQFFPPDTTQGIIDLGKVEDDFEDIMPTRELTEEEINQFEEREQRMQAYYNSRPDFNREGLFMYAFTKTMQGEGFLMTYLEMKHMGVDPTPNRMAKGYLISVKDEELEAWHIQVPIMMETYVYHIMQRYLKERSDD